MRSRLGYGPILCYTDIGAAQSLDIRTGEARVGQSLCTVASKGEPCMQKASLFVLLALVACLSAGIAACSAGPFSPAASASGSVGNAAGGDTAVSEVAFASCSRCHSTEPGVTLVGPSLAKVGATAETASSGMSAAAYLRQSIVDPNAHLVPGFSGNIMPANYGSQLTDKQIDDLVAFLMTLR